MPAFQFPDPTTGATTVTNPITGSTYQWKEPPGKWVVTVKMREVGDIIWEGDNPPDPIGDYKLWYSTDTLELYFYYCDAAGTCAWVPTSVPIQVLDDLNAFVAQAEVDIDQLQYKQTLLQNALDQIYLELQTGAAQRPPIFSTTEPDKHPDFTPPQDELIAGDIWYDNTDVDSLKQYIYDGTEWIEFGNQFVLTEGDTMTGDLVMQDANIKLESGSIIFQPIDDQANAGVDGPNRFVNLVSKRVRDEDGTLVGGSKDYGIRVDLTEGRSGYNKFQLFSNVDGGPAERFAAFNGGNNPGFLFYRGNFQMEGNRIQKLGTAELDTDAVSLGQVKDELKDFKSEIIEQAAVGIFRWDTQTSNTTPLAGRFFGKQDATNSTEPFINNFRVSNEDINGANQDFSTWEVGDIITWTNTINSAYQIRYRVDTVPTFQNGHYFFGVTFVSQTNLFMQGQDFILTRQRFTNIDFSDLEKTYLRLDASNGPIESSPGLEIKTDVDTGGGFGEAALTLNGKRDNADNSCAAIRFKNWNYGDTDEINGYITYYTNATKHLFRFNKDIDLLSGANLSFSNGGAIQHNGGDRIIFDAASNGNEGSGLVVFTRPGNTARRGVVIKGKYKNDSGNTVSDGDLFFSYTNSDVDAINYVGKISGKHNIVNKDYVDNANTGILEGKLKNKGSTGTPTSGQFVPMWGASYNSGNVQEMNTIKLHSLDGYDFRTTGSAATPGTLTIASRGDVLWHGIIEKKSVSGDTCTIYLIKLYAKSAVWDTTSDYYFHISGFKRDMS